MLVSRKYRYLALILLGFLLSACQSTTPHNAQAAISDGAWRDHANISKQAAIALFADGRVQIIDPQPRIIRLRPTLDVYTNEFAPCYLRESALINGQSAIVERPCTRTAEDADRFGFQGIGHRRLLP
ncbi:hypothetical protein L0B52_02155 [Suttonella sp. R2A3]|uniref:hypothetical protein n=1 Tax=Suttonella sp. R2A3 TaxID=2908648 RepID=UPI001F237F52|nr:hypothetical protein [Suttonella sp. R2A3]UJF24965.1 hypothetical protein L0B52_02155 [Suttonella sp. R2A3]